MPVKGYVFPDIYFGDNDLAVFGRFQFRLVIIIKSNLLCACDLVFRTQLTGQYIGCPFGVGAISESDVSLAAASDAIIVGFQVRPSGAAAKMAEQEGVDIRKYSVIYDAIEEVKAAMEGMLAPELKEQITATIEIREVFNITKVGLVAGAVVKTGKVKRSDKARLIRDGIVIFTGNINALKRFKDDVKEVGTNFECGISLVNCNDMKVGDMIETFEEIEVKQTL